MPKLHTFILLGLGGGQVVCGRLPLAIGRLNIAALTAGWLQRSERKISTRERLSAFLSLSVDPSGDSRTTRYHKYFTQVKYLWETRGSVSESMGSSCRCVSLVNARALLGYGHRGGCL